MFAVEKDKATGMEVLRIKETKMLISNGYGYEMDEKLKTIQSIMTLLDYEITAQYVYSHLKIEFKKINHRFAPIDIVFKISESGRITSASYSIRVNNAWNNRSKYNNVDEILQLMDDFIEDIQRPGWIE